jgi:hypothetical protein
LTCLFRRKIVVKVDQMKDSRVIFAVAPSPSLKPLMHSTFAGAEMLSYATHSTALDGASLSRKSLSQ